MPNKSILGKCTLAFKDLIRGAAAGEAIVYNLRHEDPKKYAKLGKAGSSISIRVSVEGGKWGPSGAQTQQQQQAGGLLRKEVVERKSEVGGDSIDPAEYDGDWQDTGAGGRSIPVVISSAEPPRERAVQQVSRPFARIPRNSFLLSVFLTFLFFVLVLRGEEAKF